MVSCVGETVLPIYEFRCEQCGFEFEKLFFSKDFSVECQKCGSADVKKKYSTFGFKSGGSFTSSVGGGGCASCGSKSPAACKSCK
jgi:putative FmdB family regulatory protein